MFSRGYKPGSKVKQAVAYGKEKTFEEHIRQKTKECVRRNLDNKR